MSQRPELTCATGCDCTLYSTSGMHTPPTEPDSEIRTPVVPTAHQPDLPQDPFDDFGPILVASRLEKRKRTDYGPMGTMLHVREISEELFMETSRLQRELEIADEEKNRLREEIAALHVEIDALRQYRRIFPPM